MTGKLGLLIGFGAGYVLGARAGRQRYDQIMAKAQNFWNDPRVQEKTSQATDVAKDKAGHAAGVAREKAGHVAGVVKEKVHHEANGRSETSTTSPAAHP